MNLERNGAISISPQTYISGGIIPLAGLLLLYLISPDIIFVSYPVHSFMEGAGSLMAIAISFLIYLQVKNGRLPPQYILISHAILIMGTLDGFHALFHAGERFVWFHSLATFAGGLGFSLLWLPDRFAESLRSRKFLTAIGVSTVIVGLFSTLAPSFLPLMLVGEDFSIVAATLNIAGGSGFFVGWLYLARQRNHDKGWSNVIFANHSFLFGIAGLIFAGSALWDTTWWYWHALRLLAYLVVVAFFADMYRRDMGAILRLNESYSDTLGAAKVGTWDWNPDNNQLVWSDEIYNIFGLHRKDVTPSFELFISLVHPDDRTMLEKVVKDSLSSEKPYDIECRIITGDGTEKNCHAIGKVEFDEEKKPVRMLGSFADITECKKAMTGQQQSERKYRELFESATEIILTIDFGGTITSVNRMMEDISGYSIDEIVGSNISKFLSEAGLRKAREMIKRKLDENQTTVYELDIIAKSDEAIPVEISSSVISENGSPVGIQAFIRDIRERKNLEERMFQAQKLESLGVLAGGIAHDFNNLLTAIIGNADLIYDDLPPGSTAQQGIDEIKLASQRAADLSRQMLAYSGKGKFIIEHIEINKIVREMAHLLESSVSRKAVIEYDFMSDLPLLEVDVTQIRQVIMNLITNASEALEEGSGFIKISTGATECNSECVISTYLNEKLDEGLYIFMEVEDNGVGMTTETIEKLFDPFFTTKFTGRGLGMSAVLGIVRGHGGGIRVDSEPGRGTKFTVLLPPASMKNDIREKSVVKAPTSSYEGTGTVLLVDDEDGARLVGKKMLERCGFKVFLAGDGKEALEVYQERIGEIDYVILDLTMPRMDGVECLTRLREIRSDAQVIISSGYDEDEVSKRFPGNAVTGYLQKPFDLNALKNTLSRSFTGG